MNYFSLYNLPEQFEVDLDKLKQNYQTLQKMTHPDRFANASDQQKRLTMQKNAQVNDAYTVLKSPIARAEHLLQLRGLELASEQETVGNVEFLMQQMEWRESLEDANDVASLQLLAKQSDDDIQAQTQALSALLATQTDEDNKTAAEKLREMKFLFKFKSEIESKLDGLDA
ncbi:Fe-S protein assembly co-chaperone HscB [Glaciecola sp. KUL10]|uniref:Fe-S protein assembly co-chaperone HscB n=1 Tax=Glaciecola sp. (strain KUL10) TaxID=2161813 RepID=UPI000D78BD77|nr:Fe-S protein assembly co-chaperone HscB [Glaciecola sp. KUL10]GBL04755.1 molecular chaperone HscB [Glaciecola sp. KUL10]